MIGFPLTSLLPQGGLGSSGECVQQRDTQPPVPQMLVRGLAVVRDPGQLKIPKGVPLWPIPSAFLLAQAPWETSPCPHLGSATPSE